MWTNLMNNKIVGGLDHVSMEILMGAHYNGGI